MMNSDRQIFFGLLRSSLWNEPCPSVPAGYDWSAVLQMAREQTLSCLISDAFSKYTGKVAIDAASMQKLQLMNVKYIQAHAMLNRKLSQTVMLLNEAGITSVLFKGQGLAMNYPDPLLRQCGDIDLYVGDENYQKACSVLEAAFGTDEVNSESVKHYHMMTDGVTVELHRIAETMPGILANRRFQQWTVQNLHGDSLRKVSLNGTLVNLPPFSFDPIYILHHAWHHFMNGGIGLRQLCDWAVYLHTYHDKIDVVELRKNLDMFRLNDVWQSFAYIAVNYLGLPPEECPLYKGENRRKAARMLDFIMDEGNFGKYDQHRMTPRPKGYAAGKLHSFRNITCRFIRLFTLFPVKTCQHWLSFVAIGVYGFFKGLL